MNQLKRYSIYPYAAGTKAFCGERLDDQGPYVHAEDVLAVQAERDQLQELVGQMQDALKVSINTIENSDAWWLGSPDRGGMDEDLYISLITRAAALLQPEPKKETEE